MYNRRNQQGPIANSYDELQGISDLLASFENGLDELSDHDVLNRTILQCIELIFLNLRQLSERQLSVLNKNRYSPALQHSNWTYSLLKIAYKLICYLSRLNNSLPSSTIDISQLSEAFRKYISMKEMLSEKLIDLYQARNAKSSVVIGMSDNPITKIAQNTKLSYQLEILIHKKYINVQLPNNISSTRFINYDQIYSAFTNPSLTGDNYFAQFRLLHQIPELLGLYSLYSINNLKDSKITFERIVLLLTELSDISELIVECLFPLLENLTPREYHLIRANLGKTSGSHSDVLANKLFKDGYFWVKNLIFDFDQYGEDRKIKKAIILNYFNRFNSNIINWREFHLGFPRNVLGGPDIKSLIGSSDAIAAAQKMYSTFLHKESPENYKSYSDPDLYLHKEQAVKLDNYLLAITAQETKKNFSDVQQRSGPIFGTCEEKKYD